MTWRTVALILGAACCVLVWRDCTRGPGRVASDDEHERTSQSTASRRALPSSDRSDARGDTATDGTKPALARAADGGFDIYGFHVPGWAMSLTPQQGEDMLGYRDRIVPLAQAAVAPHRARIARSRENLVAVANLDTQQRAELDSATQDAAAAIQDRVLNAALSGDFNPSTFKPMTAIGAAKDVLDIIDKANKRFVGSLRDDQRAKLAQHPFDFADYLLFSTKWEEALGVPSN